MVVRYLIAILIIVVAAGIYASRLRAGRDLPTEIPQLERLPRELGEWRGEDFPMDATTSEVLAADATLTHRFRRPDGTAVWLFISYFAQQQVNSQIHSPHHCVPGGNWKVVSTKNIQLDLTNGRSRSATLMRTRRKELSQDIYYWFMTQGGAVAGEYALKWDLVKNSLARRPTNAAFVRYTAATADSAALFDVMSQMDDSLNEMLAMVRL